MSQKFPITKQRIRNHFQYFWWQYAALVLVAVLGRNLVYTVTRYRSPEHLKVEWYYEGVTSMDTQAKTRTLLDEVWADLFPEMEEVTFTLVGMDESYGQIQLTVWAAAGQGDLYMLSPESFQGLAGSGSFVNLQPYVDNGTLNVEGIDLTSGYVTDFETGETVLAGIPTNSLPGFLKYDVDYRDKYMSLLITGGNDENAIKLMAYFLDNMRE